MISKKIMVQSGAAGLMAGAILAMPLFLYTPEFGSLEKAPCSYQKNNLEISYSPSGQPTFRAAPSLNPRGERVQNPRTLEERNQAARQALGEINDTYEAEQAATNAAHSFAVRAMAAQTATRINQRTRTSSDGHQAAVKITDAAMASSEDQKARALELMRTYGAMRTDQ